MNKKQIHNMSCIWSSEHSFSSHGFKLCFVFYSVMEWDYKNYSRLKKMRMNKENELSMIQQFVILLSIIICTTISLSNESIKRISISIVNHHYPNHFIYPVKFFSFTLNVKEKGDLTISLSLIIFIINHSIH